MTLLACSSLPCSSFKHCSLLAALMNGKKKGNSSQCMWSPEPFKDGLVDEVGFIDNLETRHDVHPSSDRLFRIRKKKKQFLLLETQGSD